MRRLLDKFLDWADKKIAESHHRRRVRQFRRDLNKLYKGKK